MSFWHYKKEKGGKKTLIGFDIPFLLIMMMVGSLATLLVPPYLGKPSEIVSHAFHLIAAGFFLLLISKASLFAKGIWISWGSSQMSTLFRLFYVLEYILLGSGVIIILVVYKAGRSV